SVIESAKEVSQIVKTLVEERIRQGKTQQDLAEKCGLKQSAIARMESLQAIPRLDTVLRVARGLGVSFVLESPEFKAGISDSVINLSDYRWNPANAMGYFKGEYHYGVLG
ncbi:MAG: helix-turn-helix transcriptional regulator, partial [Firmicutes bacterium]|nr:helix-turn-helix transcriptional regulator [Bacillota bacterium]